MIRFPPLDIGIGYWIFAHFHISLSPFAKASSFAKSTEDKTEDKLIRANGFMGCSFRLGFIRQVGLVLRHACTPFAESRQHT